MDYDRYSDTLPLLGTAVAQAMDGADAHATPSIDTALYLLEEPDVRRQHQRRCAVRSRLAGSSRTRPTALRGPLSMRALVLFTLAQGSHQHEQGLPRRLHRQAAVRQSGVHLWRCRDRADHRAARARDVEAGLAIRVRGHGLREG